MVLGTELTANVVIDGLDLGECRVIPALDTTLTLQFPKNVTTMAKLDNALRGESVLIITEENGNVIEQNGRRLQAYRIDGNGLAEVSFLALEEAESEVINNEIV